MMFTDLELEKMTADQLRLHVKELYNVVNTMESKGSKRTRAGIFLTGSTQVAKDYSRLERIKLEESRGKENGRK